MNRPRYSKDKGTSFQAWKIRGAYQIYNKVIEFLEHEIFKGTRRLKGRIYKAGRLNVALCTLKTGDWIGGQKYLLQGDRRESGDCQEGLELPLGARPTLLSHYATKEAARADSYIRTLWI